MPYFTVKILRKIISFYPYNIWRVQELRHIDHDEGLSLFQMFLSRMEVKDIWPMEFLYTYEADYYMNNCENTQNYWIWDSTLSNAFKECLLQSPIITLWCPFIE